MDETIQEKLLGDLVVVIFGLVGGLLTATAWWRITNPEDNPWRVGFKVSLVIGGMGIAMVGIKRFGVFGDIWVLLPYMVLSIPVLIAVYLLTDWYRAEPEWTGPEEEEAAEPPSRGRRALNWALLIWAVLGIEGTVLALVLWALGMHPALR